MCHTINNSNISIHSKHYLRIIITPYEHRLFVYNAIRLQNLLVGIFNGKENTVH